VSTRKVAQQLRGTLKNSILLVQGEKKGTIRKIRQGSEKTYESSGDFNRECSWERGRRRGNTQIAQAYYGTLDEKDLKRKRKFEDV